MLGLLLHGIAMRRARHARRRRIAPAGPDVYDKLRADAALAARMR